MEWFTADTHFGSDKAIKKSNRPFKNEEEMDATILRNINEMVRKDDVLYHLGDFAKVNVEKAIAYRKKIQCKNVILVFGNHDEKTRRFKEFRKMFVSTHDILEIERNNRLIVMCHFPIRCWHHWDKGAMHLFGHCHGMLKSRGQHDLVMDVGVDDNNFKPWSYNQIMDVMKPKFEKYNSTNIVLDLY